MTDNTQEQKLWENVTIMHVGCSSILLGITSVIAETRELIQSPIALMGLGAAILVFVVNLGVLFIVYDPKTKKVIYNRIMLAFILTMFTITLLLAVLFGVIFV